VIATEDADLLRPPRGINVQAILRAGLSNVQAGDITGGGSTITQQYVKNAFLSDRATEQSLDRKIVEAVWAVELEKRLSKDEILERYLNRTYFGAGAYGIGTAAERYFSKPVGDLTLPEAAMLAGMIRSPERNNPIASEANALARRDIVLDQMAIHGFITAQQRDVAKDTPLDLRALRAVPPPEYPFWTDWVTRLLTNDGRRPRPSGRRSTRWSSWARRRGAHHQRLPGGLRIHTTLDPEFQQPRRGGDPDRLSYRGRAPRGARPRADGRDRLRRARQRRDPDDGDRAVRVRLLPSRTTSGPASASDGAAALRQDQGQPARARRGRFGAPAGSSFKPFVIAAALEAGIPPGWTVNSDSSRPGHRGLRRQLRPEQRRRWRHARHVRRRQGVGERLPRQADRRGRPDHRRRHGRAAGPAEWYDFQESEDFRFIGCSLGLGATDVTPLEMAAGFATIANRGSTAPRTPSTRIEDRLGNVLYEHTPDCEAGRRHRGHRPDRRHPQRSGDARWYRRGHVGRN
jgi:penicillin-binding protein 1A